MPLAAIMPRRSSGEVSIRARMTPLRPWLGGLGAVGVEAHLAGGGAGPGRESLGDDLDLLHCGLVEHRGEQLVEVFSRDAFHGVLPGDQFLLHHVAGDVDGGEAGAFAVAGLEHVDLLVPRW